MTLRLPTAAYMYVRGRNDLADSVDRGNGGAYFVAGFARPRALGTAA